MLKPPYQFLTLVNGGFLSAAVARGQLVRAEVEGIAKLAEAGVLTNGIVAFTVSGEKPA